MIRRQSLIAIVVSMFLLTLAGAVAVWSFLAIHRTSEQLGEISELEQSVLALKDIVGEYDRRFDDRFAHQWNAIEGKAESFVSSLDEGDLFNAGVHSELTRRLQQMSAFFQRLRALTGTHDADHSARAHIRSRINSNADAIIGRMEKNKRLLRSEQGTAEIATFSAVLFCIVIAAGNIGLFYGWIMLPILSAFEALREEAGRIGKGDLQAPVVIPKGGEIGLLFQSLDGMRAALEELTRDLETKRADAEAAAKAKTEFLANMSHELRTPLNAVIGYADLLLDLDGRNDAVEKHQAYVRGISGSSRHLLALINDVLDFAKIDSDKLTISLERFDFRSEIESLDSAFHDKALENKVRLVIDSENAPRLIESDQMRVRQILYNLVGNAVKFTQDGAVRISVTREKRDGRRILLGIQVEDEGIGVEPERLAQIFSPFDQADNSISRRFGGTGLGLPITKSLAEALGGGVSVTSEPGKGSRFIATIEVEDYSDLLEEAPAGAEAEPAESAAAYGFHVLVADDAMINREVVSELLKRFGCTVELAENGAEAVEKAQAGPYDLIMLDVHMPVMDGVEAARQIRAQDVARDKPARIFAWTADVLQPGSLKVGPGGWNGVVLKPVSKDDLETLLVTVARDMQGDMQA
ncbi:ATP-binding protein [uncultured Nisaea sp.]|uniref:hybrid sensor histidine kinase/response regulator n=1 Tax=uncultured Nisaea sp. TaxID=538215 RepID=UPI0030EE18CD